LATHRAVVIGAGAGGLAAATDLARQGLEVTVVERAGGPGGKMRQVAVNGAAIDVGPTVFTMRWVFERLFQDAGASLSDHLTLQPVEILARHAWSEDQRLDLFTDHERSVDAIATFAGKAEAEGFRAFSTHAKVIYDALEQPFMCAERPNPVTLTARVGRHDFSGLWRISPFKLLWQELGQFFRDPRLIQLFGRYATYCGSSPFLSPATLMLVAHVEASGVWLVEGGMRRLALALAALAEKAGATVRYHSEAAEVLVERGRAAGVRLTSGERLPADLVVVNADPAALPAGLLGAAVRKAAPPVPPAQRSLSAVTWALHAETEGFPLVRHSVFFSRDYPAEFEAILNRGALPGEPTVYICAQDRDDHFQTAPGGPARGPERLLVLVNAPALGDQRDFTAAELQACEERTFRQLERCGLIVHRRPEAAQVTSPNQFNRLFPATGGAIYGPAAHGWQATFRRMGSRTKVPGLYLAGGSVHPGPGVPLSTLSGRLAASRALADLGLIARSSLVVMPGGTSTA